MGRHLRNAMDATYRRLIPFRVQRALYTRATRDVFKTRGTKTHQHVHAHPLARLSSATSGFASERANEQGRNVTPCSGGVYQLRHKEPQMGMPMPSVFAGSSRFRDVRRSAEDVILVKSEAKRNPTSRFYRADNFCRIFWSLRIHLSRYDLNIFVFPRREVSLKYGAICF